MVYPMVPNEITRTKISNTIFNFFSKSKFISSKNIEISYVQYDFPPHPYLLPVGERELLEARLSKLDARDRNLWFILSLEAHVL
jgi:hypothetical protein